MYYYDTKDNTLGEVRAAKWRAQKKRKHHLTLAWLGQPRPHLEHANYLTYLQKHNILQRHPSLSGHGWHLVNGLFLSIHFTQSPLPPSIPLSTNPDAENNSESNDSYCESCGSYNESYHDSETWYTSTINMQSRMCSIIFSNMYMDSHQVNMYYY